MIVFYEYMKQLISVSNVRNNVINQIRKSFVYYKFITFQTSFNFYERAIAFIHN